MNDKSFLDIPYDFKSMISQIQDKTIQHLYSKFDFLYFQFSIIHKSESKTDSNCENINENYILNYIQKSKFITFNVCKLLNNSMNNQNPNSNKNEYSSNLTLNICMESKFIIIDSISTDLIKRIISKIKENQISIIQTGKFYQIGEKSAEEETAQEEIDKFCSHFANEIKINKFVECTIPSIICYMVRRHFYPTEYFKDKSFFRFNQISKKDKYKKKLGKLLFQSNQKINSQKIKSIIAKIKTINERIDEKNNHKIFKENDFIILRKIRSNIALDLNLVLHLKSFYIFLMKKIKSKEETITKVEYEIHFCENYSHRCFTKFYGFLDINGEKSGFIYEFMCNGNLSDFVSLNSNKINETFSIMTINRIFQGINYLHENNLINRDLKPSNILLDHDYIPYISDFETIRHPINEADSNEVITGNLGSLFYTSPEQDRGKDVSYPTDIYSFGLIVYFLFEKKHMFLRYKSIIYTKDESIKILPMKKGSINMKNLYENCVKIKQTERLKNDEIKKILTEEFNSLDESKIGNNETIKQLIYENILILPKNDQNELNKFLEKLLSIQKNLYQKVYKNDSKLFLKIGNIYFIGFGIQKDYHKAKEYFDLSAKLNNYEAICNLGLIYEEGLGVEKNISKAKELYELAANHNNSNGMFRLGHLYMDAVGVEQNYEISRKYYELSAQQNNPKAINSLAFLYENGYGVEQDYNKAIQLYELSAKANCSFAYYNLGYLYENGIGVNQNYSKAFQLYEKAAKQNDEYAIHQMGYMYLKGIGVKIDYLKAIEYFERSAELLNSDSYNELGIMYQNGLGIKIDLSKAKELYEKAIELNNATALSNLGTMYQKGLGVERDNSKAKELYEKAIELNNANALSNLGTMYQKGLGVELDYSKAKELYEKAAELNDVNAFINLGAMFQSGLGVKEDYLKAKELYERAAQQNDSNAFNNLGTLYQNGFGVKQDYSKAKELYEKAAQQNHCIAFNNLGIMYQNGFGVKQDYQKAKELYEKAIELNNSNAFINLGALYQNGFGVKQDYSKAKELYEKAAQQNDSNAFINLGIMYQNGFGVKQDYQKAKELYEKAAQQNLCMALNNLGVMYQNGFGVKQDYSKAKELFEKAAEKNDPAALNNLGVLSQKEKNYSKAKEFYEKATALNFSSAYVNLGILYEQALGVVQDSLKAKMLYKTAAKFNNPLANTQIGLLYMCSTGIKTDYKKARKYFELAAKYNEPISLIQLGVLYENGYGVDKDYPKALEYYNLSASINNPIAFYKLGDCYKNGIGVEQNYIKAINFYELGAKENEFQCLFNLGYLYSLGDKFEINIPKSIEYLKRCSLIYDKLININSSIHNCSSTSFFFNYLRYRSMNDLGLIYLLCLRNFDEAVEFIRKAANGEYPFGQNNYGLLNVFYLNSFDNAEYMFQKASKKFFSLSEFNLGYLREKEKKIEESIEFYIKASEHEDEPLIFHNFLHIDKRLDISKIFILCFTNLKLFEYYFSKSNYQESKKYFEKAFQKLFYINEDSSYVFKYYFNEFDQTKNRFSYLKSFILNFPPFNLENQPFLKIQIDKIESQQISKKDVSKVNNLLFDSKYNNFISYVNQDETSENKKKNFYDVLKKEVSMNNSVFEKPSDLFDFVLSHDELKNEFLKEIKEIIKTMQEILYTPPYLILFGRISLEKMPLKQNDLNDLKENDINKSFYDGFKV